MFVKQTENGISTHIKPLKTSLNQISHQLTNLQVKGKGKIVCETYIGETLQISIFTKWKPSEDLTINFTKSSSKNILDFFF